LGQYLIHRTTVFDSNKHTYNRHNMILKNADSKEGQISKLQHLISIAPTSIKAKIEQELRFIRSGIKGEEEARYLIDFHLSKTNNSFVIHDLRIEYNGRVAQIDHVVIHRTLNIFVIETKHFNAGIKVNENGEFMQWNAFKKTFEGIASPFEQNARHIEVLQDVFEELINLPTRLGVTQLPTFYSKVVVNSKSRVDRPKKFDTSNLIKADLLIKSLEKDFDEMNPLKFFAKVVSSETAENIARQLLCLHNPIEIDYAKKFGLDSNINQSNINVNPISKDINPEPKEIVDEIKSNVEYSHQCKQCHSKNVKIQYGKFGYYFKCNECGGNTNIKISCGIEGHNEKLRKDGAKFYRECQHCKTSSLFYEN